MQPGPSERHAQAYLVQSGRLDYNYTTYLLAVIPLCTSITQMHELSVTQNLLEIALRHAEKANAKRIIHLNLVIGELAAIVDDSVQFYWDFISRDTIAEGAQLHFDRRAAMLHCSQCGHTFPLNGSDYRCPVCRDSRVTASGGDEFRLESIEVE